MRCCWPRDARVRPRRRERRRKGPRDEYLRPMVDVTGIKYRLGLDTADTEARIREEFEENQLESRAAVRFAGAAAAPCALPPGSAALSPAEARRRAGAGVLVAVPLLVGLVVSRLLAEPFFEVAQRYNPDVFALTDRKKVEGAKEVHKHELRLRMDAAIGRAPPLTEPVLQAPAHWRSCPGRAPALVGLALSQGSHDAVHCVPGLLSCLVPRCALLLTRQGFRAMFRLHSRPCAVCHGLGRAPSAAEGGAARAGGAAAGGAPAGGGVQGGKQGGAAQPAVGLDRRGDAFRDAAAQHRGPCGTLQHVWPRGVGLVRHRQGFPHHSKCGPAAWLPACICRVRPHAANRA